MNIVIFGASGMIGQALTESLRSKHEVTVVGRSISTLKKAFGDSVTQFTWDDVNAAFLKKFDVAINLVGENIGAKRWSPAQKQKILESRVETTAMLANHSATLGDDAPRLMNASAIGIYDIQPTLDAQNTVIYDEETNPPQHPSTFLAKVGAAWEAALKPAIDANVPVTLLRFSVVLSRKGGAFAKLLPSFQFGMGAVIGSGKQPMSWVTLDDVVHAIEFLIDHPEATGPYNIVANEVVTQKQFAKTLARCLKRPLFMCLPAPAIKLLFGEMGDELLLNGQIVKSKCLRELGFTFKHDRLEEALHHTLSN